MRGTVRYNSVDQSCSDAVLILRYRMKKGESLTLQMDGVFQGRVICPGADSLTTVQVPVGAVNEGKHVLSFTSLGGRSIEMDGFCLTPRTAAGDVRFVTIQWDPIPDIQKGPAPNSLVLKYKDIDHYYGLLWFSADVQVREFFCRDLDIFFRRMANDHVLTKFYGEGKGHFTNVFIRPIRLTPHSKKTLYSVVCTGTKAEVEAQITRYAEKMESFEKIYEENRMRLADLSSGSDGDRYVFSQERMAATLLTNVVYPVYTQKSYIRHSAPSRWWDCLYTWDSGLSTGIVGADTWRAIENLNAYTTPRQPVRLYPSRPAGASNVPVPRSVEPHAIHRAFAQFLPASETILSLHGRPQRQLHHADIEIEPDQNLGLFLQLRRLG